MNTVTGSDKQVIDWDWEQYAGQVAKKQPANEAFQYRWLEKQLCDSDKQFSQGNREPSFSVKFVG